MHFRHSLRFGLIVLGLSLGSMSWAANDSWKATVPSGNWETGTNWNDNSTPGNADTATFNTGGAFNVSFGAAPTAIQELTVATGAVTFASVGAPKTLLVNSGGNQDVNVAAGTASLLLGTAGFPVNLTIGDSLSVQSGGTIEARFGSDIVANNLAGTAGVNGTIRVDGAGSTLTVNSTNKQIIGVSGTARALVFQNGSIGSSFAGALGITDSPNIAANASVSVLSGSTVSVAGDITLANQNVVAQSGTLAINGASSQLTQTGATNITVGSAANGAAAINVGTTNSGGILSTGTGTLTINKTGTVSVGSGANTGGLTAHGDITIDGGVLQFNNAVSVVNFAWDASKTMTIQNGGRATFAGNLTSDTNAIYNISGSGSKLEATSAIFNINSGAQSNVSGGGLISSAGTMSVGVGGNGSLIVDGAGSAATVSTILSIAGNSTAGTVTFSNNASGAIGGSIGLVNSPLPGASAILNVQSGADLDIGASLNINNIGDVGTTATVTVTGAGSTLIANTTNVAAHLRVGNASGGTGVLNVQDGGAITLLNGVTVLGATGTINIDRGIVDLSTLDDQGGSINFVSGSLTYLGNLTVGTSGLLGTDLTLTSNHILSLSGTTTVESFRTLTLDGGTLNTGDLVANGTFQFVSGTLGITGAGGLTVGSGGLFGSALTLGSGRTLSVTNTATINSGAVVSVESGGTFSAGATANSGTVALNGATAIVGGTTFSNSGFLRGDGHITAGLTNNVAGEVRAETGKSLVFQGATNSNNGRISLLGGVAEFTQPLTNGANGQVLGHGTLVVGGAGLTNNGQLILSNDVTSVFGDVINNTGNAAKGVTITGNGDATFWDDVTHAAGSLFKVQTGSSATFFGTFGGTGNITGGGDVYFEADLTPGASPAAVAYDADVFFGPGATAIIEVGGTIAGSGFDKLLIGGTASLAGTLDVSLLSGFVPGAGDVFQILTAVGGVIGTFTSEVLPALGGGLFFDVNYGANEVTLFAAGVLGDYNLNGTVDAADYIVWRKTLGQIGTGLAADGNGNRQIDAGDYDVWRVHFGQTSGSGLGANTSTAIPEPTTAVTLIPVVVSWCLRRRWAACHVSVAR